MSLFPWAATNRQLSSPAAGWEQLGRHCAAAGTAVHSWWGTPPSSPCQLSGGTQLLPDNTSAGRWELALPTAPPPPPLLSLVETLSFSSAAPPFPSKPTRFIPQRSKLKVCLTSTLPGQSRHGLEAQTRMTDTKRMCPWEPCDSLSPGSVHAAQR